MAEERYVAAGTSVCSRTEMTRRKEVLVKPKPLFSEALGFTDFPSEWLPFGEVKRVAVYDGQREIGKLLADSNEDFTESLFTNEPKEVRYAFMVGSPWCVEQGVEVATQDPQAPDAEEDGEADTPAATPIPTQQGEQSPAIQDPYLVKSGDTLSAIAKACGKTVAELQALNKLSNVNQLEVGQTLYLSRESSFGVSVLFLDALRHPIANLPYKIKHDGQTKSGQTQSDAPPARLTTANARSTVEVLVQDLHGQWVSLCKVASGYGHQFLTLVSGALVFKGATEPHPRTAPPKPTTEPKPAQPAKAVPAPGAATKNNESVKTNKSKGKHGQTIIQVAVDVPEGLQKLFGLYSGELISDKQWETAAGDLQCEVAVLKAIAEVETKGAAFWRLNKADGKQVPSILYERHKFSSATKHAHDKSHPDISGPAYTSAKDAAAGDRYGSHSTSYLRLINAYRLDAAAALGACSWGKFQIMGNEFPTCELETVTVLVERMCTSDAKQIDLLAAFIRKKAGGKLWAAVKARDWPNVALYYNGEKYKLNQYDTKMKAAYEKFKTGKA